MKIIIGGAGEVGYHIANMLAIESKDIVVIDQSKEKLKKIQQKLDVFTHLGDITSFNTLRDAGVEHSDIFISVTDNQSTNLAAALIAKRFGAKKCIARVSNQEYLQRENQIAVQRLGIDSVISPEDLAANEIFEVLEDSAFSEAHSYENGLLYSYSARLDKDAIILDKSVKEVSDKFQSTINYMPIAIVREDDKKDLYIIIPRGDTVYKLNDKVYFSAVKKAKKELYHLLGKKEKVLRKVIILGGGKVGSKLSKLLNKSKHQFVIIEREKLIAEELAEEFPNQLIINGDGRDLDILKEAGIEDADAFIAVTGRAETNIVSNLMAKNYGVDKTVALVQNIDYIHISEEAGISTFVNKKLLAANMVIKHVRKGEVLDVLHLSDLNAEFLEFKLDEGCNLIGKTISMLDFPKKAIIGGIIRQRQGYIPDGNFTLQRGDKVLVFSLEDEITKVENLFSTKS